MNKNLFKRLTAYIIGLFIMTIGISFSVKADLGVSPVSSIPYTITLITGLEMGKATIVFHIFLIILQIIILKKDFKPKNLLQIVAAIIFGYFTTFSNNLMSFIPKSDNIIIKSIFLPISIVFVAFGIFLYLPADIVPLAGEGVMQAVSYKTNIEFPKIKVTFDTVMVIISFISCLIIIHSAGSVGIGTVISAFLVGITIKLINKIHDKIKKQN
jgi:uncharacterized membrane protein YczE